MHTLKMSLRNISNGQKNEAVEHPLFQNTGMKKLTSFKIEVKGKLFDITDQDIEHNSSINSFKFYIVK